MTGGITRRAALATAGAALLVSARRAAASAGGATRIAVMELDIAEAMLALGTPPIAMAEVGRFRALFTASPLPASCAELGASWEPNLERLQELAPARILTSRDREMLVPLLERIAPVTLIEPDDANGRYRRGVDLMRLVGSELGRAEATHEVIKVAERRLDVLRDRLARLDIPPVFLVSLVDGGGHLELYGAGCLLDDALVRLGLRNASPMAMPSYGWIIAGIEHLADRPDAAVLVLDFGASTRRTLAQLAGSPLWQSLPPVAGGRVRLVKAASVWGGVPTLAAFAGRIAAALDPSIDTGNAG
ncbi:ABC transporter substrate-binding protein [Ancylobacter sp. 3268]|uniref:ABC transporter substrate-binding protein n=1 Tax=Ancylobacter sp. 3268 TaxID=2817752 RepID=UPI00286B9C9C|nr:ABC transporter substrate-binding protein [Ancylobacter sp. 3268]